MYSFSSFETGDKNFRNQFLALFFYSGIIEFGSGIRVKNEVKEGRTLLSIGCMGIGIVLFMEDLRFLHAGQLLNGLVPCDYCPLTVYGKGWVGEKFNDLVKLLFGCSQFC